MERVNQTPQLTETVYEAIRDAICDGSLAQNERLIQDDLAQRLGVSRLPVHAALQQLRKEGFVIETGRRGLIVAPIDGTFTMELYELRAALDSAAATAAARNATPQDRKRGELIIRAGREAAAHGDLRAMAAADFSFHDFVYQLANNRLISMAAHMNWHHVRRSIMLLRTRPIKLGPFWDEHDQILQAVINRDPAGASQLAQAHAIGSGTIFSAANAGAEEAKAPALA